MMEPTAWASAGRALLAKMLAEWSYEDMLHPVSDSEADRWSLELPGVSYRFRSRRGAFGSWIIDRSSITRLEGDTATPADDPVRFVLDARSVLGFDGLTTCEVVRELTATQHADTVIAARALPAAATADLSYEELESHQTGHPCMVLNKGRLGFSAGDAARYAPEAAQPFHLLWIAVTPDMARTGGTAQAHDVVIDRELDASTRDRFADRLRRSKGADDYVWLPVHPFHWDEALATFLAADVATGRVVLLGQSEDRYLPLQSIRTVTNIDRPHRHDIKLPLLIRNTLVWRGLAPTPTEAAPAVSWWLQDRLAGDAFLRDECSMVILGEVASATVRQHVYEAIADAPYRYHELLGAVWRQPVRQFLAPGERARTMASLLHVGADGRALVAELVQRSGLDPSTWLRRFFQSLLPPLLHWLYRYGVAFCPHGENTVLIFDADDVPVRVAVKDLAEDVNLLPEALPEQGQLPPEADAVLLRWGPHDLRHSVVSAVFAGHFRFLAPLVESHLGVPEPQFWRLVRAVVEDHHHRFPELSERIERFGILDPVVERVCLNREQLTGGGFHDRV
ncbi:MAG: IucA/IucC family protein, partial [Acidimicrobiia bacterium]